MPRVHLVTYATPRFKVRQWFLGRSARINRVADTVTSWNPRVLREAGFEARAKGIRLEERGSGFWAWKPFIIERKLKEVPEGDIVFYCDVGRNYPFKLLNSPIASYLKWMESHSQDVMPGLSIPWKGRMSMWTKRAAFIWAGLDTPEAHAFTPIQASFSIWRNSRQARELVEQWMSGCADRALVSDDSTVGGPCELPDFHDHRHDQSLLTLCCIRNRIAALDMGDSLPPIDTQHPSQVSVLKFRESPQRQQLADRLLRLIVIPFEGVEKLVRKKIKFGEPLPEPPTTTR